MPSDLSATTLMTKLLVIERHAGMIRQSSVAVICIPSLPAAATHKTSGVFLMNGCRGD